MISAIKAPRTAEFVDAPEEPKEIVFSYADIGLSRFVPGIGVILIAVSCAAVYAIVSHLLVSAWGPWVSWWSALGVLAIGVSSIWNGAPWKLVVDSGAERYKSRSGYWPAVKKREGPLSEVDFIRYKPRRSAGDRIVFTVQVHMKDRQSFNVEEFFDQDLADDRAEAIAAQLHTHVG